jgi:hypothetical protein
MRRVVLALVAALGCCAALMASAAGLAGAAESHTNCITFNPDGSVTLIPSCSQTVAQAGGPSQSFASPNPCDPSNTGTVTIAIKRQVYHINVDGAGDAWDTGTTNGTVTFVPDDPTNPSAAGTYANWFGDSFNAQNTVQSSTFNAVLHTSDGQTIGMHEVFHVTFAPGNPVVPVVSFDKPTLSCS